MPAPAAGRLEVLPAGSPPPDPAAVIGSEAMARVLSEIEGRCDLAIIDTPAALAVSDALPLMRLVSGVVLVARMNWSGRDTVARLQKVIESAGGTPVGVVATGVTATLGYGYYSPRYYTQTGANGSKARRRTRALNRHVGGSPEPRSRSSLHRPRVHHRRARASRLAISQARAPRGAWRRSQNGR